MNAKAFVDLVTFRTAFLTDRRTFVKGVTTHSHHSLTSINEYAVWVTLSRRGTVSAGRVSTAQ